MNDGLRPLTSDEIEAFRERKYTLDNIGVFYIRGLVDACGRDEDEGWRLREELARVQS